MVAQKEDVVTLTRAQLQRILSAIHGGNPASSDVSPVHKPQDVDSLDPPSPSKLLSRVEQKRQQWQKEKDEMLEWNPWGRPGAGAPVRKMQVVAPIANNSQQNYLGVSGGTSSVLSSPVKPVPSVFKSSITFGNAENDSYSNELFRKSQWAEEQDVHHPKAESEDFHRSPARCTLVRPSADEEERRARALEYQRAIRAQMEEKRRRAEEERERRRREEEAEERRLKEDRARLLAEYEEEQRRAQIKAEQEEQKQRLLATSLAEAAAQAEAERKATLRHRNKEPDLVVVHDLAHQAEVSLRIMTPPPVATQQHSPVRNSPVRVARTPVQERATASASPVEVSTSCVQTESPYVTDRVLTPSVFRVRQKGGRECATQTDDTPPSSARESSVLSRPLVRRPKWGANQPTKAYIRASERDVRHRRRTLRHRRALSSSDCNTLTTSSELETRSYQFPQGRSRSTPRSSGVRSDCGQPLLVSVLPALAPRRQWHSQEGGFSPPRVPGVRPRMLGDLATRFAAPPIVHAPPRRKWSDQESFDLDSVVKGAPLVVSEDEESSASSSQQDPLVFPEVVTNRPTPRQDRILQNLSSLRQGLLKKQRELENLIRRPPSYYS